MIIKFKNGYTVNVSDTQGASRKEIIDNARKAVNAVKKVKDAELEKAISTNVSFQPTKLEAALKSGNAETANREIDYLMRDLEADLHHPQYPKTYRKEVLTGIVDKYKGALNILNKYHHDKADEVRDDIRVIESLWNITSFGIYKDTFKLAEEDNLASAIDTFNEAKNKYPSERIFIMNESTGEVVINSEPVESTTETKDVKDAPYYDPSDSPRFKSNYSPDRVSKEIAHSSEPGALLGEIQDVFEEIDEFIEKGRSVLTNAGWTREDARHAIKERYYKFIDELRAAQDDDIADALEARVKKLEKTWDLTR